MAAFVAGAFLASPELRAYASTIANDVVCTGCVGTSDLSGNAVTSAKIKDGEVKTEDIALSAIGSARIKDNDVKAQDLAPDSVGASELLGVTKLLFGQCVLSSTENSFNIPAGTFLAKNCNISGVDSDDSVIATLNDGHECFEATFANPSLNPNSVQVLLRNDCNFMVNVADGKIGVLVFDK